MNEPWLLWSVLFGGIGLGYFVFGRKQKAPVAFASGLALMIFPYFVPSLGLMVSIGIALLLAPLIIRV